MNIKLSTPTRGITIEETVENLFLIVQKTNRQLEYILNNLDGYMAKNPTLDVSVSYEEQEV